MAELCRFYGIIIYMYGLDHNPPHFQFTYGEYECIMYLDGYIGEGKAPCKVINRVELWARGHIDDLRKAWNLAQQGLPITKIKPL